MWNFKGTLWNSTQNIFPIHWKIWFLYSIAILRALRFKSSYAFLIRVFETPPPRLLDYSESDTALLCAISCYSGTQLYECPFWFHSCMVFGNYSFKWKCVNFDLCVIGSFNCSFYCCRYKSHYYVLCTIITESAVTIYHLGFCWRGLIKSSCPGQNGLHFHKQHFQTRFHESEKMYFHSNFTEVCN